MVYTENGPLINLASLNKLQDENFSFRLVVEVSEVLLLYQQCAAYINFPLASIHMWCFQVCLCVADVKKYNLFEVDPWYQNEPFHLGIYTIHYLCIGYYET